MSILEQTKGGRILIFTLAFCMMVLFSPAQKCLAKESGSSDFFALGNEAYISKDYDQAIAYYQAALERDGFAPSLLYNLGNAYYMKKEAGQAILNYERALYLDPGNTDIEANLALARKNFGIENSGQGNWKAFFKPLNLNGWTWIAVMALCTFSLTVFINGIRPGLLKRPVSQLLTVLCFLAFVTAGTGMAAQYGNLNRGVITADNIQLRISPFDSAPASGVVKPGKMVNLGDNYKGFVFIKTANGKSGWLPKKAVGEILPAGGNHQTKSHFVPSAIGKIHKSSEGSELKKT